MSRVDNTSFGAIALTTLASDLVLEIESLPRNLCDVHPFQSWGYCCGLSDGSGGWDTRVATRVAVLRVSPARR
jgi:hypothetical protein